MRDLNRIKPYCDELATIWGMVPDWRLGQLMVNIMAEYKAEKGTDPFYTEDEDFIKYISDYIKDRIGV